MINMTNVSISYGKVEILKHLTCNLHNNEFICIIGKNGCGKSTFLRALAGLIPFRGSINLHEQPINTIPKGIRAKYISYLPQVRPIPNMDVGTLIAHGRYPHLSFSKTLTEIDISKIKESAKVAGVEKLLDRNVSMLSGGERQRAYIAMTVAQDSEIMLLDEPTAYLDIEHQLEVMELLNHLHKSGKGIILAVHDLPQAFHYADRVILLSDGTIAGMGKPEELCARNKIKNTFGVGIKKSEEIDELYSYRFSNDGGK